MSTRNLLIVTNRTLHSAPRVIREINSLKSNFRIDCIGTTAPLQEVHSFDHIDTFGLNAAEKFATRVIVKLQKGRPTTFVFPFRYLKFKKAVKKNNVTHVIVHEPEYLPYFCKIKKALGIKLIFNAHEYYPLEFENIESWDKTFKIYYDNIYRKYLVKLDLLINVCGSIATKCKEEYNVESIVVPNAAPYFALQPTMLNPGEKIRIIHHGAAIRARKLETMMEVVGELGENYELDMMIATKDQSVLSHFKAVASQFKNVRIIPPVAFDDIIPFINQYHIGLYMLAPVNFNNRNALPNKFFEFLQARLCIAVSPNIEMKELTEKYALGIVSADYEKESMIAGIQALARDDINRYKENAVETSKKLTAEFYEQTLFDAINKI